MQITGKDLVLLIIKNDLMNEKINISVTDALFLTAEQAAVELGISTSSLLDMANLGVIDSVIIGDTRYFRKDIDLKTVKRR